jgi:hypothetical protein
MDRDNEANSRFSPFCERAEKNAETSLHYAYIEVTGVSSC